MPRAARELSGSGIYHIVFRGINHQLLFEENADCEKLTEYLTALKEELHFHLHAYCLMGNHVHLLLQEKNAGQVSQILKRLLIRYVGWYNRKYKRTGPLIENRYKSKPVEADDYFLPLVRYIHLNPVRAGLVNAPEQYPWSSHGSYLRGGDTLTETQLVFSIISPAEFTQFHQENDEMGFYVSGRTTPDDEMVRRDIFKKFSIAAKEIALLPKSERNRLLCELKAGYSIRQLERVTGISRGIIANVDK